MSDDLDRQLRERLQRVALPSAPGSLRASLEAIVQTPPERTVRRDRRRTWRLLAVAAIVATAGLAVMTGGGSPPPDTALVATASPSSPFESAGPSLEPSTGPSPTLARSSDTPGPTDASTPSLEPLPAPAPLVRGSARAIGERVLMAPGPDGTLFVSIPRPGGSVLALLDGSGRPRPGWPISVEHSTSCELLLPVDDGSVRVVCDATDLPPPELDGNDGRALAFDAGGRPMAGWPIELRPRHTARVVGTALTMLQHMDMGDVGYEGQPDDEVQIVIVGTDGARDAGLPAPIFVPGCCHWEVGPDGVAYGVSHQFGDSPEAPKSSQLMAVSLAGVPAGFPVAIDGTISPPAFDAAGRILVAVSSFPRLTSRVVVFDHAGVGASLSSAELPIATGVVAYSDGSYECGAPSPRPPLVAGDGTIFVFSEIDTAVFALDPSLAIMPGWPFEPVAPLVVRDDRSIGDLPCGSLALPAVGPDSILYLPLQARDARDGGSLVAVGPDGQVRPGWPVELTRPGAEFWSVIVGSDGTAYALAIEPETGDASSASILAIAPDSTVLSTTTIIEP